MVLTETEIETYTGYLTEARGALHKLTIGGQARTYVDQNGERVEFTAGNRGALRQYIWELETKLGLRKTAGPMTAGML